MKLYNPSDPLFSLHIPKSGGTSFRSALVSWFTKHNRQFMEYEKRPNLQIKARWFIERGIPQVLVGDNLLSHYKNHSKVDIPNIVYKIKFIQKLTKRPLCIHGHFSDDIDGKNLFDFYPEAKQFIAFVRDPVELHLSMFHYHIKLAKSGGWKFRGGTSHKIITDIDEWLEEHNSNLLDFFPFHFDARNYEQIINDNFIHIGVTEKLQESLAIMADKLSKPAMEIPVLNVAERFQKPSESAVTKFKEKHLLEYTIYNYSLRLNK